eukprot:1015716-Pelagomonas_calceolata.AAC.3
MTCCAVEYCALLAGKEVRTQVCCSDLSMLPVQGCCMVSPASARLFSKHVLHLQDVGRYAQEHGRVKPEGHRQHTVCCLNAQGIVCIKERSPYKQASKGFTKGPSNLI